MMNFSVDGISTFVFLSLAFILFVIIRYNYVHESSIFVDPARRAGRLGEKTAINIIKTTLRDGDKMFTNIKVSFENRPAELDVVIVNRCGIFIIEVKNYSGYIVGKQPLLQNYMKTTHLEKFLQNTLIDYLISMTRSNKI